MSPSVLIFWSAVALVGYAYVGYPLLLMLLARFRDREIDRRSSTPFISVVISVYNESENIGAKLDNILSSDYPPERVEILVISDGSDDGTDEIVRGHPDERVSLSRPFAERRGKAQMLNTAIPGTCSEIIVLTDARQPFEPGALKGLASYFADPTVGAVSGELHLEIVESTGISEGLYSYWQYEKTVRKLQSRVDSVIGATGAIYAIRRSLFRPIPDDTNIDDVAIPMSIAMQGYRVVFAPEAKAFDRAAESSRQEWVRKVRTLSGNYALLFQMPHLLNPRRNRLFFHFVSHKVASRLLVPFALVTALVANLFVREGIYAYTLMAQILFYALGAVGLWLESRSIHLKILSLPNTFLLLNASALAGLFHFLTTPRLAVWEKGES
jgi:cellulose synthase/poly-beta-1,6-N-acetylglucosamine synthase-like glycosyltransferase